jgi:hypothetical protein
MFFGKLLPRDGNFFEMFNQHADRIVDAAQAFSKLVANYGGRCPELSCRFESVVMNIMLPFGFVGLRDEDRLSGFSAPCDHAVS